MTNLPFGFSPAGDDDPDGGPGPNPGAFDLSQLGSMLSQLGQMLSQSGTSASSGPVNYQLAQQLATSQVPATHPVSSVDVAAVRDAIALVEVWLDGVTSFPAGAATVTAWTPRQWIEATMPTWEKLCSPIANRVSTAWVEGLPEEARTQAGPLLAMMGSMGGMAFGTQLGQGLAQLSGEVLTSTDVGLPLGPEGTSALLPHALAEFGSALDLPEDQVRLYMAAREAAHQRLYAHVPWLRGRVLDLIASYAGAITVDFSGMEELASSIDPTNPASIEAALGKGMFEPTVTDGQQRVLAGLEALLALVEGWVDTVVAAAVGDRLPGASALRETLRRRRATGGPAEQTFATLIGLELRPRRLRAAADLWRELTVGRGIQGRDALWSHPDLLPSSDDLADPAAFIARDKQFNDLLAGLDDLDGAPSTDTAADNATDNAADAAPDNAADAAPDNAADAAPDNAADAVAGNATDAAAGNAAGQGSSDGAERPDSAESTGPRPDDQDSASGE